VKDEAAPPILQHYDRPLGVALAEMQEDVRKAWRTRCAMLPGGHELVVFGYVERFTHRAVKAVEDRLPVGFRLFGAQSDVSERHQRILFIPSRACNLQLP